MSVHTRDATPTTGFDRHYLLHTAWAIRVLARSKPEQHFDIASSLYFVTALSAFVPTTFVDYRPVDLGLVGLTTLPGTLMALPFADDSVQSLSCMHVIEHIGLGRYGDPVDYDGDLKALTELIRVLAPGGRLLLVLPIGGESRIQFNAHRIYRYEQVLEMAVGLALEEFALIEDEGGADRLHYDAPAEHVAKQRYGCGCFSLRKIQTNGAVQ